MKNQNKNQNLNNQIKNHNNITAKNYNKITYKNQDKMKKEKDQDNVNIITNKILKIMKEKFNSIFKLILLSN